MNKMKYSATDVTFIENLVSQIIEKEAPEESELVSTMVEQQFHKSNQTDNAQNEQEQIFGFSGQMDIQSFLALALLHVSAIVIVPFLKKALEEAIEKTAEKSVEALATNLHNLIEKHKKKPKDSQLIHEMDLLVPLEFEKLNQLLARTGRDLGLSHKHANDIAGLAVHELSDDRVLVGEYLIHVSRIQVPGKK